jgi:serine/threonine protein kinase
LLPVGFTIDERYRVERFLAKGGMGTVYAGRHVLLGTELAIKVLRLTERANAADRFLSEARLACKFRHPNLVQVLDCGMLPSQRGYLVMELLSGRTLASCLKSGPLDMLRICQIGVQLARGLQAIHAGGIVHCDMKALNVVIIEGASGANSLKIVDFGIARSTMVAKSHSALPPPKDGLDPAAVPNITADQTGMAALAGTPPYMSPEQCQGLPLDGRSDMYSLGCILYEMLSGKVPFTGSTAAEIMDAHLTAPVPRLRSQSPEQPITPSLERTILRMLAKDVSLRFASMAEVETRLIREANLLRIQRGEQVVSDPEQLEWLVRRDGKWQHTQVSQIPVLRPAVAFVIAMMSIRLGAHMKPAIPPLPSVPKPPYIVLKDPRPPATKSPHPVPFSAETLPRRSDSVPASAAPAAATDPLLGPPAR